MESFKNLSQAAEDFSGSTLGVEEAIQLSVNSPIFRYWEWLLTFFGRKVTHTNKCPMFHIMWISTMGLIALSPFMLVGAAVFYLIISPLIYLSPWTLDDESDHIPPILKYGASLGIGLILAFIFYGVFYIGFFLTLIFSLPAAIILLAGAAIYWAGWGIWWFISVGAPAALYWFFVVAIPAMFVAIYNGLLWLLTAPPWLGILLYTGYLIAGLVLVLGFVYLLYKATELFANSKLYKKLIDESCKVRENTNSKYGAYVAKKEAAKVAKFKKAQAHQKEMRRKEQQKMSEPGYIQPPTMKEIKKHWLDELLTPLLIDPMIKMEKKWEDKVFIPVWKIVVLMFIKLGELIKKVAMAITVPFIWMAKAVFLAWKVGVSTISNHCPAIEFVERVSFKRVEVRELSYGYGAPLSSSFVISSDRGTIIVADAWDDSPLHGRLEHKVNYNISGQLIVVPKRTSDGYEYLEFSGTPVVRKVK